MIKQCVILVVYKGRYVTYPKTTPPTVGDPDFEKKTTTAREKHFILAESRYIIDYHSTNAHSVRILFRLTPKMTRFVLP